MAYSWIILLRTTSLLIVMLIGLAIEMTSHPPLLLSSFLALIPCPGAPRNNRPLLVPPPKLNIVRLLQRRQKLCGFVTFCTNFKSLSFVLPNYCVITWVPHIFVPIPCFTLEWNTLLSITTLYVSKSPLVSFKLLMSQLFINLLFY